MSAPTECEALDTLTDLSNETTTLPQAFVFWKSCGWTELIPYDIEDTFGASIWT